jgi:hypothetical protein
MYKMYIFAVSEQEEVTAGANWDCPCTEVTIGIAATSDASR